MNSSQFGSRRGAKWMKVSGKVAMITYSKTSFACRSSDLRVRLGTSDESIGILAREPARTREVEEEDELEDGSALSGFSNARASTKSLVLGVRL